MQNKKNIYFLSDLHLGLGGHDKSIVREKKLIKFLDEIKNKTQALYLVGDIFDFWHEYKRVVPRGFTRFLGKIAEFTDNGIPVYFFTGNHDIWAYNYLPQEIGVKIFRKPQIIKINDKTFYIAHGDGLGPYDKKYKFLKSIFTNKFLQWMFARLHPNFALSFGLKWSHHNRESYTPDKIKFKGEDKEWLILYAKNYIQKNKNIDYFVFGHRHIPLKISLNKKTTFINLGDWINNFTYGVFDGKDFKVIKYETNSDI